MLLHPVNPDQETSEPAKEEVRNDTQLKDLATYFKILSDETRLNILSLLGKNYELHVNTLCERLGQSQPLISHHLAMLSSVSLVARRREGKRVYYRVRTDQLNEVLDLLESQLPVSV